MAKKRTMVPFYGKREQAIEGLSQKLADQGHFTEAGKLIKENSERMKKRRKPVLGY